MIHFQIFMDHKFIGDKTMTKGKFFFYLFLLMIILLIAISGCKKEPIEKVWEFRTQAATYSTPLVTKDFVIFGNEAGYLYAIMKKDGKYQWRFSTYKEIIAAPKLGRDLILFGSTNYLFYAIDMAGREVWKYTTKARIKSDPLVVKDTVIFTSYDGHVYAVKIKDKEPVWIFPPLKGSKVKETEKGKGEVAKKPAIIKTGEFSYSAPCEGEGTIFVGNLDNHLYAINFSDGTLKWKFAAKDGITSSPLYH